jgi:hypothetical protein
VVKRKHKKKAPAAASDAGPSKPACRAPPSPATSDGDDVPPAKQAKSKRGKDLPFALILHGLQELATAPPTSTALQRTYHAAHMATT